MRKFTLIAITFLVFIAVTLQYTQVQTNAVQPQSARTNAPDELNCGDDALCHNTEPNTFGGNVAITYSDPANLYVPGNTYTLTVTVTDATQERFGFEITSLDSLDIQAGTFAEISGSTDLSFPIAFNGRLYAAHHNAGGGNIFNIAWTAPITDVGDVTFFTCGNAANGNGLSTGDHIYCNTFVVSPDNGSAVQDISGGSLAIQSLVANQLLIKYDLTSYDRVSINLFDASGNYVKLLYHGNGSIGEQVQSFDVSDLSSGLYIVQIRSGEFSEAKKVVIQ